jgi:Zn-finger nucleic acid-binding protein
MKCPHCKHDLTPLDYKGIQIHECANCKGRWFDRDGLKQAKDRTDENLRWLDFDPFGKETDKKKKASRGKECPRCSVQMDAIGYDESNVVIDKCPHCFGIWLDHSEFERILTYLENMLSSKSASEYAKLAFTDFVRIFAGHEGLVSEVRDFFAVLKLLELRIATEHPGVMRTAEMIFGVTPFR